MSELIDIPYLITEPKAAKLLGISTNTLRGIRLRGKITYREVGERVRYTQEDLKNYLGARCNDSKSETTGSPNDVAATTGAEPGSIVQLDKHVAALLAQRTFGKHSSNSPNG